MKVIKMTDLRQRILKYYLGKEISYTDAPEFVKAEIEKALVVFEKLEKENEGN